IRDEAKYKLRFQNFATFYHGIKGEPYAPEYERQYTLHNFPKLNLVVLGLNSAWEIDHHYTARAGVHSGAITNALEELRRIPSHDRRLKVAVWHHPIHSNSEDRITDHGFLQRLAASGFRIALHGHIHKAENNFFRYDMSTGGRKLDLVCAGTFGAPTRQWVPGYPLEYNLLKVYSDKVVVETRHRAEREGAWKPYAVWTQGPGKDPLPRYEVKL
ncbi:MAG: metallophosphoesterase family protein, partial [Blastocatellia bacterium]